MILILKTSIKFTLYLVLIALLFFIFTSVGHAQTGQSLSVSPTIFDMSANPGQEWTSNVRVINPNPFEITVFAEVVNFLPDGEAGQGRFIPIIEEQADGQSMAEWIEVTEEEIIIPAEQTTEVSFVMSVPDNAAPGGHFAAMLIGTKPPEGSEFSQMVTSQIVTTLLFMRLTGDIIEDGQIRSFRPAARITDKPVANFELRFENNGNVHILPQGEIKITNMWGQERGVIPINRSTLFGNVLPESVRKYNLSWSGEWSIADMGRYTAVVSLAYGDEVRKFSSSQTTFWVLPWKIFLTAIVGFVIFIYIFTWGLKLYIRRMLDMAGVTPDKSRVAPKQFTKSKKVSVVAPFEAGMLDLRSRWDNDDGLKDKMLVIVSFVGKYRVFFIFVLSSILFLVLIFLYVKAASISDRSYNVTIDSVTGSEQLSSEDLRYEELVSEMNLDTPITINNNLPAITIVNRSGIAGLAADLRFYLENRGYQVLDIQNELGANEINTVIIYDPELREQAVDLSEVVFGALISAFSSETENSEEITIFVGKDLENALQ